MPNTSTSYRSTPTITGELVYQEGKRIEGDYYIISVFEDSSQRTVTFVAYDLNNTSTNHNSSSTSAVTDSIKFSFSDLDNLFKYNTELLNPSNKDSRFHWVIERLDFVVDGRNRNKRVLCVAPEPTPEVDIKRMVREKSPHANKGKNLKFDSEGKTLGATSTLVDNVAAASDTNTKTTLKENFVDNTTKAKLNSELSAQNDETLFQNLVESDQAKRQFLVAFADRRRVEQVKALERKLILDERSGAGGNNNSLLLKPVQSGRFGEGVRAIHQKKSEVFRKERAKQLEDERNKQRSSTLYNMAVMMNVHENEAVKRSLRKKQDAKQAREVRKKDRKRRKEEELQRKRHRMEREREQWKMLDKRRTVNGKEVMEKKMKEQLKQIMTKRDRDLEGINRLRMAKERISSNYLEAKQVELEMKRDIKEKRERINQILEERRTENELIRESRRNERELKYWKNELKNKRDEEIEELEDERNRIIELKMEESKRNSRKKMIYEKKEKEQRNSEIEKNCKEAEIRRERRWKEKIWLKEKGIAINSISNPISNENQNQNQSVLNASHLAPKYRMYYAGQEEEEDLNFEINRKLFQSEPINNLDLSNFQDNYSDVSAALSELGKETLQLQVEEKERQSRRNVTNIKNVINNNITPSPGPTTDDRLEAKLAAKRKQDEQLSLQKKEQERSLIAKEIAKDKNKKDREMCKKFEEQERLEMLRRVKEKEREEEREKRYIDIVKGMKTDAEKNQKQNHNDNIQGLTQAQDSDFNSLTESSPTVTRLSSPTNGNAVSKTSLRSAVRSTAGSEKSLLSPRIDYDKGCTLILDSFLPIVATSDKVKI